MSEIAFLLNGEVTRVTDAAPTRTLLDWLREDRALPGTKEGCNEGDCGACSVIVTDRSGSRSLNACILFLPQLQGCAVRTVEGISGPQGELHPVQQAMIEHHGSQCGFCTPGFITTMATAHKNGQTNHNDQLAGNLCRCTGYAPIVRAAEAAADDPVPEWMHEDMSKLKVAKAKPKEWARPGTTVELAKWVLDHPSGTLVGGATDVGLWVTKGLKDLKDLGPVAFIDGIDDLSDISITDERVRIGAAARIADVMQALVPIHPDFAEMLRRYGSTQVRNAATIGGNIANASPIGDCPPALIALGATLHLRRGVERRDVLLENYFIDYGKQDRVPGEFVEAVSFPRSADRLKCYKLSKRFDQDISAVLGCFNVRVIHGVVTSARIAFGGMAGIPKRARAVETTLIGKAWDKNAADRSWDAFEKDFAPLSDMRASAEYRLEAARGMLSRYLLEDLGADIRVLDVRPVHVKPVGVEEDAPIVAAQADTTAAAIGKVGVTPKAPEKPTAPDASLADVAAAAAAAASAAAVDIAAKTSAADATAPKGATEPEASPAGPEEAKPAADVAKGPAKPTATKTGDPGADAPSDPAATTSKAATPNKNTAPDAKNDAAKGMEKGVEDSKAQPAEPTEESPATGAGETTEVSEPKDAPPEELAIDSGGEKAADEPSDNGDAEQTAPADAPGDDKDVADAAKDKDKDAKDSETDEPVAIILPPPPKDPS